MHSDLGRQLSLIDSARIAQFSPYHFHRLFVRETGTTPARFLTALRMAEARRLLLRSHKTVTAISAQVGYASVGTFTSQFHRSVGMPPERFRRLVREIAGVDVADLMSVLGRRPAVAGMAGWPSIRAAGIDRPGLVIGEVSGTGTRREERWWTAAPAPRELPLSGAVQPGDHVVRLMVLPAEYNLVEALIDGVSDGILTGAARFRIPDHAGRNRKAQGVGVPVRSLRLTDPPMLSAAMVRWLRDIGRDRHLAMAGRGEARKALLGVD